jgi:hypothetical protein
MLEEGLREEEGRPEFAEETCRRLEARLHLFHRPLRRRDPGSEALGLGAQERALSARWGVVHEPEDLLRRLDLPGRKGSLERLDERRLPDLMADAQVGGVLEPLSYVGMLRPCPLPKSPYLLPSRPRVFSRLLFSFSAAPSMASWMVPA